MLVIPAGFWSELYVSKLRGDSTACLLEFDSYVIQFFRRSMTITDLMFASSLCLVECNINNTIRSAVCCLIPVDFWSELYVSKLRGASSLVRI